MSAGKVKLFAATDPGWMKTMEQLPHDVFHRPDYHSLPGFGHQGTPWLFTYQEGEGEALFAWPYLLRPIPETDHFDVSSVYGYSGPLCNRSDAAFRSRAWHELRGCWRSQRAVAAFTRFHPILCNADLAAGWSGDEAAPGPDQSLFAAGSTISIDLTLPPGEQVKRYQKVLRQEIRKAHELGFATTEDSSWDATGSFVRLYRETMARRNSKADYLVDEDWVSRFRHTLGQHARLFVTTWQGSVAAALLAIEYGPFLHAHLTGINSEMAAYSPLKVLLDDIRTWGTERGLRSFHLGGGLGGREDSLFHFKRRFSPVTHLFQTGRWILDEARYRELEREHHARLVRRGYSVDPAAAAGFFPSYRWQPSPEHGVGTNPPHQEQPDAGRSMHQQHHHQQQQAAAATVQ